jgi:hypothetical protein
MALFSDILPFPAIYIPPKHHDLSDLRSEAGKIGLSAWFCGFKSITNRPKPLM